VRRDVIDINARDEQHITCLQRVCATGNVPMCRSLLSSPKIDVNAVTEIGYSALHFAIASANEAILALLLLRADTDVNIAGVGGVAAIHLAVQCANLTMLQMLSLRRDLDVNARMTAPEQFTPLMLAAMKPSPAAVRILLANPRCAATAALSDGRNALSMALDEKSMECVELLRTAGSKKRKGREKEMRKKEKKWLSGMFKKSRREKAVAKP
jgi:ankyrin repeat protein